MRFTRNMPASDHLPDDAQEGSQSWNRRALILGLLSIGPLAAGCRGYSYGQLLKPTDKDLVGSHEAGSEVFHPLVDESVAKLLSRQQEQCIVGPDGSPQKKTICFVCVENKMSEDI
ncbi:MAG: hypothetical protein ACOVNQ_19695, partial [Pirellula sp.]